MSEATEFLVRGLMMVASEWADEPNHADIGRSDRLETAIRATFSPALMAQLALSAAFDEYVTARADATTASEPR